MTLYILGPYAPARTAPGCAYTAGVGGSVGDKLFTLARMAWDRGERSPDLRADQWNAITRRDALIRGEWDEGTAWTVGAQYYDNRGRWRPLLMLGDMTLKAVFRDHETLVRYGRRVWLIPYPSRDNRHYQRPAITERTVAVIDAWLTAGGFPGKGDGGPPARIPQTVDHPSIRK